MPKFPYPYQCFTLREHFIDWAKRGIPAFPIVGEKPCIPWEERRGKVHTMEEVDEWFKKYSPTGLAILTGKSSNKLIFDIEKGQDITILDLPFGPMTGADNGNTQYWFQYPNHMDIPTIDLKEFAGINGTLRADNSYVIVPCSQHPSGSVYEWLTDNKYVTIDPLPKKMAKRIDSFLKTKKIKQN